uniref:MLP-like protein 34 n=1 Tax=Erigeron canadensis TaxID=72917 RepID=UPI001CB9023E|nr:MLP-like protein 34 [Erigeron canadensis]
MASIAIEIEVASEYPADKVFKVFSKFDSIAPKVNPRVFKSIETIEGNGDVGTVKVLTFGEGVPFTSAKYKVDAIDATNYSYSYTFFEGDNLMGILHSITSHVKIVPSADGGCVNKQTITYNCKGNEKPSEDFLKKEKEGYENTYKAMEAYAIAHPETFMASLSIEIEVASQYPADKVFKVFSKFDSIAPKVNPQVFKSIETIEGNGDVGTIKVLTFGEGVPFTSAKYKVDAIDASNFTYSYSFFEGDNLMGILHSITSHVKIVPSADDGGCVNKQTITYVCKGDEKPSEDFLKKEKEVYENTYKAMEAYAVAHPETFMASIAINIEVASQYPADKVFKVFSQFDSIAPKVNPQVFKSIETIEGNGDAGTIKVLKFGDGVPFTSAKYKVDNIDATSYSYSYTFFEGDNLMGILDSITSHVKIVPSADGGCVNKQTITYHCRSDEKPSDDFLKKEKEVYEKTYKAMEAYAAAHPEIY